MNFLVSDTMALTFFPVLEKPALVEKPLTLICGSFPSALRLPTFQASGMTVLKRLTLIAKDGDIVAVHYPVFPSDSDPQWVIEQLRSIPAGR